MHAHKVNLEKKIFEKHTVVFWGAGPKVPRLIKTLCEGADAVIQPPSYIFDTTRQLGDREFGIPTLDLVQVRGLDPERTLIVISAGLLDLQANVIRNGLYYFEIIEHRALELLQYDRQYPKDYEASLSRLRSPSSQKLYSDVVGAVMSGSVWNPALRSDGPFFGNEWVPTIPVTGGAVVFAGAYDGELVKGIISTGFEGKIFAFEPNPDLAGSTSEIFADSPNVHVENALLGAISDEMIFHRDRANNGLSARLVESETEDSVLVPQVSLDSYLGDEKISMIALDIEGSEFDCLKGAVRTITSNSPVLSICIYHSPRDLLSLIPRIDELFPDIYDFELLQHSSATNIETVAYGLPRINKP